ncbi:hypothetical protein [Burkholderia gladioli]|uniref:hypothetical protein n=1 Tax=Burkholderia gladioli TaxID=28095 RepID=UPI00163F16CF|nr:hypothetical protein [Burkholderia gladioli]
MKNDDIDTTSFDEDSWVVKHTVEFWVQKTSARVNNFSETYFFITQDSFLEYLIALRNPDLGNDTPENFEKHLLAEKRLDQSALKTIVFAAMTCEAAIYDIAAIHLSDAYAMKVLDRLDPISKWLVAPRLICGHSLREDGPAMNSLRSLFAARNELMHAKSLSGLGINDPENFKKIFEATKRQTQKIMSAVVPAYQAIVLLSLELERLFGTASASLPRFAELSYSRAYEEASEDVKQAIRRCKEIDANFVKNSNT